jgi:hypothetical protein
MSMITLETVWDLIRRLSPLEQEQLWVRLEETLNAQPNALTRQTFADTDAGRNLARCADMETLFHELEV